MKYLCLIYSDETMWPKLPKAETDGMMAEYMAFTESLKKSGQYLGSNRLQPTHASTTVRIRNGKLSTTDGPFAETKELLGGLLIIEARDLNVAIQLISKHPGVKMGPWEIRPVEDMTEMIRESERRRSAAK